MTQKRYFKVTVTTPIHTTSFWVINYERSSFIQENYRYAENTHTWPITAQEISEREYTLATN
jgi:hypothetical protein